MTDPISVSGLTKRYGHTQALDGLDLTVRTGEVHGFLGPNGAGKSTTIRILLGLHRADAGTARLLGGDPWRDAVAAAPAARLRARRRGALADAHRRRDRSTCSAGCAAGSTRTAGDELLERFELDPTKKGRAYSKGNRQKVALVAALAADVELLLLDEPTSGLDPLMERGVPRGRRRGAATPAAPCCCPATSWPRSRRSATGSASSAPAGRSRPARWPSCGT